MRETLKQAEAALACAEEKIFGDFTARHGLQDVAEYEAGELRKLNEYKQQKAGSQSKHDRLKKQLSFEQQRLIELEERIAKLIDSVDCRTGELHASQRKLSTAIQEHERLQKEMKLAEKTTKECKRELQEQNARIERARHNALATKHKTENLQTPQAQMKRERYAARLARHSV
jgi:chromosome segregation ATPase